MKAKFLIVAAALIGFLSIGLSGCNHKCGYSDCGCGDSCKGEECECGEYNDKPDPPRPIEEIQPTQINVYIDGSGSMKGYFAKGNMTNLVQALVSLDNVAGDTAVTYKMWGSNVKLTKDNIVTNLQEGRVTGKASEFDKILAPMVKEAVNDTLTILMTDGILSSASNYTSRNNKFTDDNRAALAQKIQNQLNGSDKAVSVYRMTTGYNGTYYNKANKPVNIKNSTRPFYMIVIGDPANVRYFDKMAEDDKISEVYDDAETLHFATAPAMKVQIEPIDGKDNQASAEDFNRESDNFDYTYSATMGFRVGAELPEWIDDNFKKAQIIECSRLLIDDQEMPYKAVVDDDWIYFNIPDSKVEKLAGTGKPYTVRFEMRNPAIGAWRQFSTDDDTTPDSLTTYLLNDFMEALRMGAENGNKVILESEITVTPE